MDSFDHELTLPTLFGTSVAVAVTTRLSQLFFFEFVILQRDTRTQLTIIFSEIHSYRRRTRDQLRMCEISTKRRKMERT
jgi:hypothetical protein